MTAPLGPVATLVAKLSVKTATPADRKNLASLLHVLKRSPAGWSDAQFAGQNNVSVVFDMADGGALYSVGKNRLTLNRMKVPRSLATSFCHEVTHARLAFAGLGGSTKAS